MLTDESHGFPLREHAIKSEKENILKYEKYMNVKISKRQFSHFSYYLFHSLSTKTYIFLYREKKKESSSMNFLNFLASSPPLLQTGSPCLTLQSVSSLPTHILTEAKILSHSIPLLPKELLSKNSPTIYLRIIINL